MLTLYFSLVIASPHVSGKESVPAKPTIVSARSIVGANHAQVHARIGKESQLKLVEALALLDMLAIGVHQTQLLRPMKEDAKYL